MYRDIVLDTMRKTCESMTNTSRGMLAVDDEYFQKHGLELQVAARILGRWITRIEKFNEVEGE